MLDIPARDIATTMLPLSVAVDGSRSRWLVHRQVKSCGRCVVEHTHDECEESAFNSVRANLSRQDEHRHELDLKHNILRSLAEGREHLGWEPWTQKLLANQSCCGVD
eukprot:COSAG02_NODE_384_length_23406_cov_9.459733_3_plen_107_part_00